MAKSIHGRIKRKYKQASVKKRIEALFLDNIGKILTREQEYFGYILDDDGSITRME